LKVVNVEGLYFSYKKGFSLKNVSFSVEEGELFGIIGPNGAGKTTLLKILVGLFRPSMGVVEVFGEQPWRKNRREMAKLVTLVSQEFNPSLDFSVEEIVFLGRFPHLSFLGTPTKRDKEIVERSLTAVGMSDYRTRTYWTLSAGEKRKVVFAKAIAQDTRLILVDELTAHLDYASVRLLCKVMSELKRTGKTIVAVFHDLNIASQVCDRIMVMKDGEVFGIGRPEEILKESTLEAVYGARLLVLRHPISGRPLAFLE